MTLRLLLAVILRQISLLITLLYYYALALSYWRANGEDITPVIEDIVTLLSLVIYMLLPLDSYIMLVALLAVRRFWRLMVTLHALLLREH